MKRLFQKINFTLTYPCRQKAIDVKFVFDGGGNALFAFSNRRFDRDLISRCHLDNALVLHRCDTEE